MRHPGRRPGHPARRDHRRHAQAGPGHRRTAVPGLADARTAALRDRRIPAAHRAPVRRGGAGRARRRRPAAQACRAALLGRAGARRYRRRCFPRAGPAGRALPVVQRRQSFRLQPCGPAARCAGDTDATIGRMLLRRADDASRYGVVALDHGRVAAFRERPEPGMPGIYQRRHLCVQSGRAGSCRAVLLAGTGRAARAGGGRPVGRDAGRWLVHRYRNPRGFGPRPSRHCRAGCTARRCSWTATAC